MKLTKKSIIGFVTVATLLAGSAPSVFAVEVGTATPKGKVNFVEGVIDTEPPTVISPETEPPEEVKPEEPNFTTGLLRIVDAPVFDFGDVAISSSNALYSVKTNKYSKVVDGVVTATPVYKAPMVQIEDIRGETATQTWSLAVSATEFKTANDEALTGAEIRVKDKGIVFNNTRTPDRVAPGSGINTTAAGFTIGSTAKVVLSSEAGKGNSITSLALDPQYKEGGFDSGSGTVQAYTADTKVDNVQLFVPVTATKITNALYTSTISWTLSDTPDAITN